MNQEEDDLEEQLRKLDVHEDLGSDESDITPTNSPRSSPPIFVPWRYPSSKSSGFCDFPQFERVNFNDDYNSSRSGSSLSWGEDEFEGEATRTVNALFDQLDDILYKDQESRMYYLPESIRNNDINVNSQVQVIQKENSSQCKSYVPISKEDELMDASYPSSASGLRSFSEESLQKGIFKLSDSNFSTYSSRKNSLFSKPSNELIEETRNWLDHFPHFRIKGHQVSHELLEKLESYAPTRLTEDCWMPENEDNEEEIIEIDGNFDHLLHVVSLPSKKASVKKPSSNPSNSSRVCSGSSDPDVLREQLLIQIFDKIWPKITDIITPLLKLYAKYVIEQSTLLDTNSFAHTKPLVQMENINSKILPPRESARAYTSMGRRNSRIETKLPSRPISATNRLPSADTSGQKLAVQQLHDLLLVTSKPLQHNEEKIQASSALRRRRYSLQSNTPNIVSLPAVNAGGSLVNTPRTPTTSHPNHPFILSQDRPASNSYGRRTFHDKFYQFSLTGTINEMGDFPGSELIQDIDEGVGSEESSGSNMPSSWNKHVPFLPPINKFSPTETPGKLHAGMLSNKSDLHLSIRGTALKTHERPSSSRTHSSRSRGVPIAQNAKEIEVKSYKK